MTTIPERSATPHRLLLATDLSARCDRALDRAAQLALEGHAELVALHVLDPAALPDQALAWASGASDEELLRVAQQQLTHDLVSANIAATLSLVRSKDVTVAIRETAARTQSSLVVTGVSRNEVFGRFLLGTTVEKLARSLPQPLLVVRKRSRGVYRRIVVATDFSASSRHALRAAAKLFPGRELVLYHAHAPAPVMSGMTNTSSHPDNFGGLEQAECDAFMADPAVPEGIKLRPVIEYGSIESALTRYVREHDIDLVAMGSHGRSGLVSLLLGSTAAKLLDWLPCDMLLAREPRTAEDGFGMVA